MAAEIATALDTPLAERARLDQALLDRKLEYIVVDPYYQFAKRVLDIVLCLVILLPLTLITLIMAAVICLDSPGSFLFQQRRVGARGEAFTCLKFRSMYSGSDDKLHREATATFIRGSAPREGYEGGQILMFGKVRNDPRITRVGQFIRSTSLDELPQFWNVLAGQMTLVGPRPPLPYEVDHYSAYARLRLSGKPGITGPWQVYGRNRVTFEQMIDMDITYLQRQSLLEDIKLILLTVPAMLRAPKGA